MEERQKIRERLDEQSIKLKEIEGKLAQVWKNHDELQNLGSSLPRSAKVIETFYSLTSISNGIKAKMEASKFNQNQEEVADESHNQKNLSKFLHSKKLERQAKECVLNYFK